MTQASRQPGSTFKLVVYLAALQAGMDPDDVVDDSPIETGEYRPSNYGGRYRGEITLREAFAVSSNVVAVRLYNELGSDAIAEAAATLGLDREFPANASVALGSADMPLIELVSAYAAVASGTAPVTPFALPREEPGIFERLFDGRSGIGRSHRDDLLEMLSAAVNNGTAQAARLSIPAYGKTGTTQDSRDAVFVGFAGDLVVGVWIGNDDNSPLGNASGGGAPARIWRDFMSGAISDASPYREPRREPLPERRAPPVIIPKPEIDVNEDGEISIDADIGGARITVDEDGIRVEPPPDAERRFEELERQAERAAERAEQAAERSREQAERAAERIREQMERVQER